MISYLLRRIGQSVLVMFFMTLLVFIGVYAIGDPVDILISQESTPEAVAKVKAQLGFDKPLYIQYFRFIASAAQGDLGNSFQHAVPAFPVILERMPATMELAVSAMLIAIVVGIPLGLVAGLNPRTWYSKTIMTGSILGFSLPTFWIGLMLIMFFSVYLGWLPSSGRGPTTLLLGIPVSFLNWEGLKRLLLPAVNLALFQAALITRLTYAGTREASLQDYVKFARAKGLWPVRIIGMHILKNIMIPIVTIVGLEFGSVVAFAIVTESVFAWPGMGKLLIDSIGVLDRPVMVAYLLIVVTLFVVINLLVDLLYSVLDPRVRVTATKA